MSHIRISKYKYQVCPSCNSKKVSIRSITRSGTEHDTGHIQGFLCDNCDRFHHTKDAVYMYDRAEMKRDMLKIKKFLAGDKK